MVAGALQRHHPEQAGDRFFVDDLIAQNEGVFTTLLVKSSPSSAEGNGPKAKAHPPKR
jgi:hypothetical protein